MSNLHIKKKLIAMSDMEERPSKIRKLSRSEDIHDFGEGISEATTSKYDITKPHTAATPGDQPETLTTSQVQNEEQTSLSKNQLKKLKKQQEWEAGKEDRKIKRREKIKEKKARKVESRKEALEKVVNGEMDADVTLPKKEVKKGPARPIPVPVSLIMDCDFNELMTEKELISLAAQLTRCYSDNRTNPYRTHLVVSSWGGKLKTRFETVLANNQLGWKGVRFIENDFLDATAVIDEVMKGPDGGKLVGALAGEDEGTAETKLATQSHVTTPAPRDSAPTTSIPKSTEDLSEKTVSEAPAFDMVPMKPPQPEDNPQLESETITAKPALASIPSIVYLTSDSPYTLDRLEPYTSYIVGGIVDKNRHKDLCYKRAREHGIATAKLPIGEYMTMQSRSVLAINHVVEIMLKWLETGDWGEAFLSVIPKRKEAKLRVKKKAGDGEAGNGKQEEAGESSDEEEDGVRLQAESAE